MSTVVGEYGSSYDVEDTLLNSGGQSVLFRCRDTQGHERVYKRYNTPLTEPDAITWVSDLVKRGREVVLAAESGAGLAENAISSINWPIDLVKPSDHIVGGVVLPLMPDRFLRDGGRPRTLDFLCLASAIPPPPDSKTRLGVLIRLCDIFVAVDEAALIHGDVSAKNVVWSPDKPHAYLIDCDGIRPVGSTVPRGVGTVGWKDPRWTAQKIPGHDNYSDRFALAVALYRGLFLNPGAPDLLSDGTWNPPTGLPHDLDPRLHRLFERAFNEPFTTDDRPTAAEWRDALTAVHLTEDGRHYRKQPIDVLDNHSQQHRDEFAPPTTDTPKSPAPPGPKPAPSGIQGVLVAAAVLTAIALIIVGVNRNSNHSTPTTTSSPTYTMPSFSNPNIPYTYAPQYTIPPRPVEPGQCVDVTADGHFSQISPCDNGATYFVTQVLFSGGTCPHSQDSRIGKDGYQICLETDLSDNYCYHISGSSNEWVTRGQCYTPGTSLIVNHFDVKYSCSYSRYVWDYWWVFTDRPDIRYCADVS